MPAAQPTGYGQPFEIRDIPAPAPGETRTEFGEVIALAETDRLSLHVERHPHDDINDVFMRLEHGEIAGRAVLIP